MGTRDRRSQPDDKRDGVGLDALQWALGRLQERGGIRGEMAGMLRRRLRPGVNATGQGMPLFADEATEERVRAVADWYRPYGDIDALFIPMTAFAAVRAARELARLQLVARLAWAIRTPLLLRDRRLMDVLHAIGGELPDTVWEVYRVTDEALARWLLAQPLEARAVLNRSSAAVGGAAA